MIEWLEIIQTPWLLRALITSSIIGVTCGLIGCFIVLKNMSLIGDALSHSILPGIYFAFVLVGYSTLGFFLGSVIAGIVTALAITLIQTKVKTKSDAAIGIVFTAMFSIGVIGISSLNNEKGTHLDLQHFLFGTVLGISSEDIYISFFVMLYTIIAIVLLYRPFFLSSFQPVVSETMGYSVKAMHYFLMLLLSFAVVAALSSVGVILVVAMLITPAATALLLRSRLHQVLITSAIIGMLSSIAGMATAIVIDIPPGPSIVLVATTIYILAALFAKEKGMVFKWYHKMKQNQKILQEDIVKLLSKENNHSLTPSYISQKLHVKVSAVQKAISQLISEGYISEPLSQGLTAKGLTLADNLVRAHRLWETYQVNKMGMDSNQIHDDAERLEHRLTEAQLDELDMKLGFPTSDPHGSPIPPKLNIDKHSLLMLKPKSKGIILKDQDSSEIESELWELGILPNSYFVVVNIKQDTIIIKSKGVLHEVPAGLAAQVKVK